MNNQPTNPAPAGATLARKLSLRAATRLSVVVVVTLLTLVGLAIAVPWTWYRYNNVVLSEATIKGTVTRIGARIEGRIKGIEVERGQHVSKGQVLLRLEDQHLKSALDRSRAELQSTTKELVSEKMGIEQTRRRLALELERVNGVRKKATGEMEAQKAQLERYQKQYERISTLLKTGAAALVEMERVTADRDRAQALLNADLGVLESAESNYQKAMNELDSVGVREARLSVLDSQIVMAQARVATCEAELDATVIRAPEEGRVLERIVEVGGSARVGDAMISLWIGKAWVEAWADERDLRKIKLGSRADVSLDASPSKKIAGRVEAIGLVTDKQLQPDPVPATLHAFVRQNAMLPVRIALDEEGSRVQLGLSAVVGIRKEFESSDAGVRGVLSRLLPWAPKSASTK